MRSLAPLLAAGWLAGCAPTILPPPPLPAAANDLTTQQQARDDYIARVLSRPVPPGLKGLREVGEGTGFYVSPDRVLTNFHVAGTCAAVTVGNGTEGRVDVAHLAAGDPAHDLALLAVDVPGEPASFEAALYTERGLDLAIVGYPAHGLAVRIAELSPVTAGQADLLADRPTYPFHGEVHPGNSGSPVLDDTGAVIGVVVQKIDTVAVYQHTGRIIDNIGIAIANRVVLAFLAANHVAVRPAAPAEPLAPAQFLDLAHGFVRQIGCWR